MRRIDLRTGASLWEDMDRAAPSWPAPPPNARVDIAIVGAGITGAFLAERFTRAGFTAAVLDGRAPQNGATAASTALVMWETDAPMIELEQRLGFETAAAIWRRCFAAVQAIGALGRGVGAEFTRRDSVYLAGDMLDSVLLKAEADLRRRAGLPSAWADGDAVFARERVVANAALCSQGAGEMNPILFARALLRRAAQRGAFIYDRVIVSEMETRETGVRLATDAGVGVEAANLLLATGYEMPAFVPARGARVDCTWVISAPMAAPPRSLIWEASRIYTYMRSAGARILIGGEDESGLSAAARDACLPQKAQALARKLRALLPGATLAPDLAWTAYFGATEDGLPLIGPVPGAPHTFAAYGYGGNGITFSALAADLLFARVAGAPDPLERCFALDRF